MRSLIAYEWKSSNYHCDEYHHRRALIKASSGLTFACTFAVPVESSSTEQAPVSVFYPGVPDEKRELAVLRPQDVTQAVHSCAAQREGDCGAIEKPLLDFPQ